MEQFGQNDSHSQTNANVSGRTANDEERKTFYLRKNNQQFGPYNLPEVMKLLKEEQFTLNNLACAEGMSEWQALGKILKSESLSDDVKKSIQLDNWREHSFAGYQHNPYYGVGGWLLLFCVGLTILGPLLTLGNIGQTMQAIREIGDRFPSFKTFATIEIGLMGTLVVFSLYAGLSLWTRRPGAVATARVYLVCFVLFAFLDFGLISAAGLPEAAMQEMRTQGIIGIVRAIIYSGIWLAYLSNSKRVEATYPRQI